MSSFQVLNSEVFSSNFRNLFDNLKLNVSYETFLDEMKKNNVIISGSSVLSCLLGENFNNDIDIYVPFTTSDTFGNSSYSVQPFENFLYNSLNEKAKETVHGTSNYIQMNDVATVRSFMTPRGYYLSNEDENDEDNSSEYRLETIVVRKDIKTFIQEIFDFSFCKVFFDGENVYGTDSLENILLKRGKLDRFSFPAHGCDSNYTYIRNFFRNNDTGESTVAMNSLIKNDSPMYRNLYEVAANSIRYEDDKFLISLLQTISRIKKYNSRGFTISY